MKRNLLFLCMVLSICIPCIAQTFSATNPDGVSINYEITSDTTVAVIEGDGSYVGSIIIPDSVQYSGNTYAVLTIKDYAFQNCNNLKYVEIPNTVISIGGRAFENCTALDSVTIGNSVKTIEYDAFKRTGLKSAALPNSLEFINYHAFDGCSSLDSVSLGNSLKTIRENVFSGCSKLTKVNVNDIRTLFNIEFTNSNSNPLSIAKRLYLDGTEVTELVIPEGITEIPSGLFNGITSITSIIIPSSVTSIAANAFNSCTNLSEVTIPETVKSIGDGAFSGCTNLATVNFPETLASIDMGQNVFANTAWLNSTGNGVIYIGTVLYKYQGTMPDSTTIQVKEGTTSIAEGAFQGCTGLTNIEIPTSVTHIGKNAFNGTTWYNNQKDGIIYINNVLYKYKGTMPTNTNIEIADGTISISSEAFLNYSQLTKIILPNTVTTIDEKAFSGCSGLIDLTIGDGLTNIGNYAFQNCNNLNNIYVSSNERMLTVLFGEAISYGEGQANPFALAKHLYIGDAEMTELTFPNDITEINQGILYNFGKNITSVTIPESVTAINDGAFEGWTSLTNVSMGSSVKCIGANAFKSCTSLKEIELPIPVSTIEERAFESCSSLSTITLGDSVKVIEQNAFNGCSNLNTIDINNLLTMFNLKCNGVHSNPFIIASKLLVNGGDIPTELNIPEGVTEISSGFLYNFWSNITSVSMPKTLRSIGSSTFSGWSKLESVVIGDSVKTIGDNAFNGCTSIDSITIPNQVVDIKGHAFRGCTNLSYITIGDSVQSIGQFAFTDCSNLQTVNINRLETIFNSYKYPNSSDNNPFKMASTLHLNGEEVTELVIPEGITEIKSGFLYNFGKNVTSVILPNSLGTIMNYTFQDWSKLEYLTLGDSIRNFGYQAFHGCDSLTINVTKLETLFNDYSFGGNGSNPFEKSIQLCLNDEPITELVVPNTVKAINAGVFNGRKITALKVSDSVEKIGNNAFSNCKDLTSVNLGQSVDTIFADAFRYCSSIESIVIPNSVKVIDDRAFEGCTRLSTITLGDSVTFIGWDAFYGCDSLQRVEVTNLDTWYAIQFENDKANPLTLAQHLYHNGEEITGLHIPDGIAEINEGFFKGYENITSVVLPNSVKRIGDRAFRNLANLQSVTLNDSLETIGEQAFENCTSLTSITIPNSIKELPYAAFNNCTSLSSVVYGNSLLTIGSSAFENCRSLSYISLGDSIRNFGYQAFHGCDSLTINVTKLETLFNDYTFSGDEGNPFRKSIQLCVNNEPLSSNLIVPNTVKIIPGGVFVHDEITSLTIPNSVHTIANDAFYGCSKLSYVSLGDSIQNIGWDAFGGCDSLTVNVSKFETFFGDFKIANDGANLFEKAIELCVNNEPIVDLVVPNTVTKIRGDVFRGSKIEKLIIPNSVKTIDEKAFSDCKALSYISLGDSLDSIGTDAFYGCNSLTINVSKLETLFKDCTFERGGNPFEKAIQLCIDDEPIVDLEVPNTVTKIPGGIFNGKKIASVTMPNSVKTIASGAFHGCVELSLVSLGNSLETIGEGAFTSCKALTSIGIPNSVKVIGGNAFEYCEKLTLVSFGNHVDSIGHRAFANCYALESIELPNSIKTISNEAFRDCINLNTIIFGNNLQVINENTFNGCSSLTSIKIPDSVTRIGWGAFWGCSNLSSVTLGNGLRYIDDYAFANCHAISQTIIPSIEWLFSIPVSDGMSYLFESGLYIGQQPLTSLTIPDNVTVAPILPELYRTTITSLNTGNGLKTLPEGKSEHITQVTLGSSVTKVESEFPNALIVVSNVSKAPTITENTFPKCMWDNGGDGVVVLLSPSEQNTYSKAKIWENMQLTNQSNQVEVNVATPGELDWEILQKSGIPAAKVVGLTVSGEINDKDFVQMKSNMKSLLYLDLTNAKITNIPNNALDSKQQLLSLALPNTVKTIGAYAFRGCSGIKELELPTDLEEIGEEAFIGINIETLDFNYALKKIGNRAFANTPLKEISFQNKVEVIGNEAFRGCNLQQELTFSDALISIGERAFEGHRGITGHLTIPDGVTSVGQSAFAGTSISTVFISGKMTTLESSVFADCDLLDVVYIPDNITRIKSSAFQGCESLKNLRLSQNIEVIEREAFRSIPIKSVNIPDSVEKIDGYAFADCANLRFVTLPANIESLDEGVFSGCRQLMNLTVKNITPPTVKANTFRGVNIDKCIISIPTVAYKPYVLAEYWGRFVQMRNDIAVQMKGNGSISFASGDTMEDEEEASSRMMMATRAGEETESTVTTVEDGSSLYVPQNGLVRFYITPASGEEIVSATFDGVDITAQIVDGIYETTADKRSANLVVSFSEKTKTTQTITWEQEFEPMMVGDKATLNATASSGLVVTYEFADGESSERAELSDGIITILKSGNISLVAKQSGNEEYASATTDVKYIKAYAYGDANGNMEINSADLAVTVDYAIGNEPQEFFFRAADVNKDKNVNVADVSGVVDIVLSAPAATDNASGNAREFDTSDNMVSILEGNSLNFYFTNKEEGFLTFQCDIRMAEGSMPELDITGNPIVAIRNKKGTGNHIAVARLLEDGYIRILVYSTDNTPIPSNYSFALSLENEPNESDVEILNAGYSYRDSEQIAYGRLNCGVVTGLDSVMDEADQMDIKVNGNTISFYSATDCLMPIVSVNGMTYMLNVKAGFNEFTVNKGVYVIGKNKVIIK
ncbi:MAG: leucine-rich repeat protein [Bacteroidaceae bacterium]|nr:leucine-rich repeat protein [Bacteroidaceae bacterium]